jgi:hypothetical protein
MANHLVEKIVRIIRLPIRTQNRTRLVTIRPQYASEFRRLRTDKHDHLPRVLCHGDVYQWNVAFDEMDEIIIFDYQVRIRPKKRQKKTIFFFRFR